MPGSCEAPTRAHSRDAGMALAVALRSLVPIGVAVAAGCEPCAAKAVARALEGGSSPRDVETTLRIVAGMSETACFAAAAGVEVVARMSAPLAAARKVLDEAARETCRCGVPC